MKGAFEPRASTPFKARTTDMGDMGGFGGKVNVGRDRSRGCRPPVLRDTLEVYQISPSGNVLIRV